MTAEPLAGKRVLVTRPSGRAATLEAMIRRAGGEPILWPAIEIHDPLDFGPFDDIARRLQGFHLAIFISRTAVERAFARIAHLGEAWPNRLAVAALGPATSRELAARGLATVAPEGKGDSEALLALPALGGMKGKRVVIFRGSGGRELLATVLAERGARVEYAECYRREPSALPASPPAWTIQPLHAVTVSSGEGLASVGAMLGRFRPDWRAESALFVPHERVAEEARRLGIRDVVVAGPGDDEIATRLVAYFRTAK